MLAGPSPMPQDPSLVTNADGTPVVVNSMEPGSKWTKVLVGILLLAVAGTAAWWFVKKRHDSEED